MGIIHRQCDECPQAANKCSAFGYCNLANPYSNTMPAAMMCDRMCQPNSNGCRPRHIFSELTNKMTTKNFSQDVALNVDLLRTNSPVLSGKRMSHPHRPPHLLPQLLSQQSNQYNQHLLLRSILLLLHLLLSKRIPIQIQVQAFQLLLLKLLSQLFRISLLLAPPLRRKIKKMTWTWMRMKP